MSGEVDGMSGIERRTLYRVMENGDYPVPVEARTRWVVPVEERQMERLGWVPADHLRGAVGLIERARYCVTAALNCPAHPWHGSDEARKWLIEAHRLGGQ